MFYFDCEVIILVSFYPAIMPNMAIFMFQNVIVFFLFVFYDCVN